MDKTAIKQILIGNHWFQQLPEPVIEELIDMASVRYLQNGQLLYAHNDEPEGLYGVIEGAIRIGISSAEGKQAVFAILESGSWLGETAMFDDQPRPNDAEAQGETEILFIPRVRFQAMLERRPELYKHFIKLICEHFRRASALVADCTLRTFPERLAKQLLALGDTYGTPCEEGLKINLHLSQEDLGMMAGTTRQRINKELKNWERQGWIHVEYGRVVIKNRAALVDLISVV